MYVHAYIYTLVLIFRLPNSRFRSNLLKKKGEKTQKNKAKHVFNK